MRTAYGNIVSPVLLVRQYTQANQTGFLKNLNQKGISLVYKCFKPVIMRLAC